MKRICQTLAALALCAGLASAQDIKIAHVYDKTGALEAYAKQTQAGLLLGLQYATGGTMMVKGRKLVVIEKDDQGKPDVGKAQLAAAFADDKADIAVGPTSSGVALAMLPVAEEYKKILLVEPAVADSITGDKWNRYIFRTGRNSSQDAISNAVALDKDGVNIATLAQDYAFGKDFVKAFKGALKHAKLVHEEYLPANTTDFTAGAQHLFDSLKDLKGRKIIFINWAGAGNPFKIADLDPKRYGIEISTGGNILPALAAYKAFPGLEGAAYYYYEIPKNPVEQVARGAALQDVQRAARLLHLRRHVRGHRAGGGLQEDQGRHQHRRADHGHGRDVLRNAQGQDDVPQGGPPGAAGRCTISRSRWIPTWPGRFRSWSGRSRSARWTSRSATGRLNPGERMTYALETRELTIRFGGHVAVDHVSCGFAAGHADRHRRPQRRGQDHLFQPDFRPAEGQLRARCSCTARTSARARRPSAATAASAAPSS